MLSHQMKKKSKLRKEELKVEKDEKKEIINMQNKIRKLGS